MKDDGGEQVKFFADTMLGRLARWMRALGYDVEYDNRIGDRELIVRALKQNRIILTRDTLLVKRRGVRENHFFITSDHIEEQLRQIKDKFGISRERFLTRCLRCNLELSDVEKRSVKELVPPYVFKTQERFSRCSSCGRIYWAATHREHMEKELSRMLGGL